MRKIDFGEGKFDEKEIILDWHDPDENPEPNFFGGLGPMNTVADFISELNDSFFRDILGNETMDRPLGSFTQDDLFRLMARIFLNTGFEKWAMKS